MSKIIAIDFDGVIRIETDDLLTPVDRVYPGSEKFISSMKKEGNIVMIFTARKPMEVAEFLSHRFRGQLKYTIFGSIPPFFRKKLMYELSQDNIVGITNVKHPADVYIDDHGLRFSGDWNVTATKVKNLLK